MREIKFRAWDKNIDEFLSWNYIKKSLNNIEARDLFIGYDYYNRKDLILMQYTGLKDKNGKEIYEGDIVKTGEGFIGVVSFYEGEYLVELPYEDSTDLSGDYESLYKPEVLGNIYKNKKLLDY